jgi:hypothetical protein
MFKKLGTSLNALTSLIPKRLGTSLNDQSKHVALTSELFEKEQNEIPEELRNMAVTENIKEAKLKKSVKLKKLTDAYQNQLKAYENYYYKSIISGVAQDVQWEKYNSYDLNMKYASQYVLRTTKEELQNSIDYIEKTNVALKKLKDDWNEKYDAETTKRLDKKY